MIGAIIGDMVGAPFEFDTIKTKDFPFVNKRTGFTDDTVMTIAVAEALMKLDVDASVDEIHEEVTLSMLKWGSRYPYAGYGTMFSNWLDSDDPKPYESYGNGSAMRISSVGWLYPTLDRVREVARAATEVTHNHPEGIKGAVATASAVYLARVGVPKEDIRSYLEKEFGYDLSRTIDEIRPSYYHREDCQRSVPEALICFFDGRIMRMRSEMQYRLAVMRIRRRVSPVRWLRRIMAFLKKFKESLIGCQRICWRLFQNLRRERMGSDISGRNRRITSGIIKASMHPCRNIQRRRRTKIWCRFLML